MFTTIFDGYVAEYGTLFIVSLVNKCIRDLNPQKLES